MSIILALLFVVLQDGDKPAGHSIHGEAFNDGPRQQAYLMPGMGEVDFPVTTKAAEAQAFINQGVGQLHAFYYFEAERSFRQAAKLDPDCAMAYWGMAMANVNNAKRAEGVPQGGAEKRKRQGRSPRETALSRRPAEAFYKPTGRRQGPAPGLRSRRSRRSSRSIPTTSTPAPGWPGHLAELQRQGARDRQPPGGRRADRPSAPGRADAPRRPPLPHPPLGRRESRARR